MPFAASMEGARDMSQSALLPLLKAAYGVLAGRGLSRIPGAEPVSDLLLRLACRRLEVIQIQGSRMHVNLSDPDPSMRRTFRAYVLSRVHEEATTDLFRQVVKEGNVVLDLGANLGYFTLLAAKLVGPAGRVYSFEPEPRNFGYLRRNVELNGYEQVTAVQKAVSDRSGTVKLYLCSYDTGHHTIQQYDGIRAYRPDLAGDRPEFVEVDAVRLDDFLERKITPIHVIKMDVEGAEMLALSGMEKLIKANDRLTMFVEFFPLLIREMGSSPEELVSRLLEDFGFTVSVIPHDYSMADTPSGNHGLRINTVEELMNLCRNPEDHLNLLLKKPARRT
jgi:FkbM family methyltransferase